MFDVGDTDDYMPFVLQRSFNHSVLCNNNKSRFSSITIEQEGSLDMEFLFDTENDDLTRIPIINSVNRTEINDIRLLSADLFQQRLSQHLDIFYAI